VIGELSPWHLLIVAIVFIVLFGSKKLPDASRSLGRSLRIFKAEVSDLKADFKGENDAEAKAAQPPAITAKQDATAATTPQDHPVQKQP
jgi:sec-independent protein translocase protein TatA